jgi:hypothetical protein
MRFHSPLSNSVGSFVPISLPRLFRVGLRSGSHQILLHPMQSPAPSTITNFPPQAGHPDHTATELMGTLTLSTLESRIGKDGGGGIGRYGGGGWSVPST